MSHHHRSKARAKAAEQDTQSTRLFLLVTGALAAIALVWAAFSTVALAEDAPAAESGTFAIDESHVHAAFKVSHLGFSETIGGFDKISGSFTLDAENLSASSVSVTIDTASVDSGWDARDEHLRGDDFFKVEEFPDMTFASTSVEPTGDTTAKVTGDLTMLGQTHPVTLDVTFNQAGKHPFSGKYVAGFSATGTLDRTQWGMEYGVPAIGKDIDLMIQAEGVRAE
ncbi:YceI family protein [Pyruvatibacter sp. HU-CL02332]|uniref:YceI family protein n=1 Tax=Pyruvatibacter sp. HU-CL02332 TaxID=3127650 RepID=UPI003109593E